MHTLKEFFPDHENLARAGRALYKYTDCGPWIVAILQDNSEVYYDTRKGESIQPDTPVRAIKIGAIVEGMDGDISPCIVYDPKYLYEALDNLDEIHGELFDITNNTNEEEAMEYISPLIIGELSGWKGSYGTPPGIQCAHCNTETAESEIIWDDEDTCLEGRSDPLRVPYCPTCADALAEEGMDPEDYYGTRGNR